MKAPIYDFVNHYREKEFSRFHMPGHKGRGFLGCERSDITEIDGADVLYSAEGIINESEENATSLFSSLHTFYSTEGSTLCIKAMLTLICKHAEGRPLILAARNAHKAFIYAGALLDFDVEWMYAESKNFLCSCKLTKEKVSFHIKNAPKKPDAVYITSPDYLGSIADIKGIAEICDEAEIPLIVDNAHGAYLKFLKDDIHPLSLGATMCCDSAHKTLPVLTGGAYLHLSEKAEKYLPDARDALALHASTSPSYLILQSLDLCNAYLKNGFEEKLTATAEKLTKLRSKLSEKGFEAEQSEPLKLVFHPLSYGYTGYELSRLLYKNGIVCEFYDRASVVIMATAENSAEDFERLSGFFEKLGRKEAKSPSPVFDLSSAKTATTLRQAMLSESEYIHAKDAVGRICAEPTVSCPPAVPICVSGEIITKETADAFAYYGFEKVKVLK